MPREFISCWIFPDSSFLKLTQYESHMDYLKRNPSKFLLSREQYDNIRKFAKENQLNIKEELVAEVSKKGYIRVREYVAGGWGLHLFSLDDETKKIIFKWAASLNTPRYLAYDYVKIEVISAVREKKNKDECYIETTVKDILNGSLDKY